MEFYNDKYLQIRKRKKITVNEIAEYLGLTRKTIWTWEKGKVIPSEQKVRELAKLLKIPVEEISSLKSGHPTSDSNIKDITNHFFSFMKAEDKKRVQEKKLIIDKIQQRYNDITQASIVINAILSSLDFVFYVKDKELNYIIANHWFLKNCSLPKSFNVTGMKDTDFFPIKEARLNEERDKKVLESGKAIQNSEEFIPGTRKKRIGIVSRFPILDNQGKIAGLVCTFINITERKKEQKLNELLKKTLDTQEYFIWLAKQTSNGKFKFLYTNKALNEILTDGFIKKIEENINNWVEIIHPDYKELYLQKSTTNTYPKRIEYKIKTPQDAEIWVEDITYFYGDYYFGFLNNITERKNEARHREELDIAIKAMDKGIALYYPEEDKYVYLNDSIEKIFEYPLENFYRKGREFWFKQCVHPDDHRYMQDMIKNRGTIFRDIEYRIITPSGNIKWINAYNVIETYDNKKCQLSIITDVSEQKIIEENNRLLLKTIKKTGDIIRILKKNPQKKTGFELIYYNEAYESFLNKIGVSDPALYFSRYPEIDSKKYPDLHKAITKIIKIAQKGNYPFSVESEFTTPGTGKTVCLQTDCFKYNDFHISLSRDITEKRNLEKAKSKLYSLEILELFSSFVSLGVIIKRQKDNALLHINEYLENLLGHPSEKFVNRDFWLQNCVHEDYIETEQSYAKTGNWPPERYVKVKTGTGENKTVRIKRIIKKIGSEKLLFALIEDINHISQINNKIIEIVLSLHKNKVPIKTISEAVNLPLINIKNILNS